MNKDLLCDSSNSLIEVMRIINKNGKGVCFVIDESKSLKGVVTDGDIRRALLDSIHLDEKVENILSKDFCYGNIDEHYDSLIAKISDEVNIIPLVNNKLEVIDFFEYKQNHYFPVAIPNLNGNEFKYLMDAFMSTWISSSGEYIEKFENEFAKYSDCQFGAAVSNGTVALHLALVTLGIGKGDEVIVPDLTYAATINTVLHTNATPVIVDVEEDSWCINPKEIEKAITSKTKAIIPVHVYGQACDMETIMSIAKKHNLKVIEDCAEAHGAMFNGKKVGSFGDIGCFSFFGNKVITTGEGGMCVTKNQELDNQMRILRDHGMSKSKKYWHEVIGYNYRMTNLQAAIGLAQLERIENIHANRREYENNYKNSLPKDKFIFQKDLENRRRITWLVCVLLDENIKRDDYLEKLEINGIDARPFFYPLSDMDIYKSYSKSETPVAHKLSRVGLNLPTYESLKSMSEIRKILIDVE